MARLSGDTARETIAAGSRSQGVPQTWVPAWQRVSMSQIATLHTLPLARDLAYGQLARVSPD
jgi:hypothetical protein